MTNPELGPGLRLRRSRTLPSVPVGPYLVPERPWQQSIVLPFHDHDEERQVGPLSRSVAIQVEPQAQLVAILGRVESCSVEVRVSTEAAGEC